MLKLFLLYVNKNYVGRRYGFITLTDCLNEKQWSAKNFIDNMGRIDKLAEKHRPFRETFEDVPLTPVKPV